MNTKLQKINLVITGVTGMVGEGVLHECLDHDSIESVLVLGRRPCAITHPKLKEIVHSDFLDLSSIASRLVNYNACFFCLGVSSVGLKEPEYSRLTYDLTMHVADTLARNNPELTFCYVSGAGTDSSEKGRLMWARVKGKTENDLKKLPFKSVFNFRPGVIEPTPGLKNTLPAYKWVGWLIPVIRFLLPNYISSLKDLGLAMINCVMLGYEKDTLEVRDIKILSKR